jgi:hypothetical protein
MTAKILPFPERSHLELTQEPSRRGLGEFNYYLDYVDPDGSYFCAAAGPRQDLIRHAKDRFPGVRIDDYTAAPQ